MFPNTQCKKYDYDFENDSIFFYGSDRKYKISRDLDGIILDISEDGIVMAIEILDASKRFNVQKSDLSNINRFNADIYINKDVIKINMKLEIKKRNAMIPKNMEAIGLNDMNLPISNQEIALVC